MRDKMIRNRRMSGERVDASIDTHLEDVVSPLEVTFSEHLVAGEILPDLRTLFRILQRILAVALQELVTAGDQHLWEIDNDVKLRQRRDGLVASLVTKVRSLRNTLDGLFGPRSALQLAAIDGRIDQEPVALLAQVERILARFSHPELELSAPGFNTQMDPAGVVEDFQAEYLELKTLVTELNRENRRSDRTVIVKNEAMSRYDLVFRWIAGCLESFYHLADEHELAARVKPSTRRPGRTQADVEAEESAGSEEPPEGSTEESEGSAQESESGSAEAAS